MVVEETGDEQLACSVEYVFFNSSRFGKAIVARSDRSNPDSFRSDIHVRFSQSAGSD